MNNTSGFYFNRAEVLTSTIEHRQSDDTEQTTTVNYLSKFPESIDLVSSLTAVSD